MQPLDRDVETLRTIPLFSGLPTARLKLIAYTAEVVRFRSGEVIARQGEPADAVEIITEGEAEAWLTSSDGRSRRLWTTGRHSLLDEAAVLCRGRRTATVLAKGDVVTFKISANVFLDVLRQSPDVGIQVMRVLAQRLEHSTALLQRHVTDAGRAAAQDR